VDSQTSLSNEIYITSAIVVFLPNFNYSIPLSCNELDQDAQNVNLFANGTSTYNVSGFPQQFACASGNGTETSLTCHAPTIPNGKTCAFTCPLPSLTDDQYDSAKIMQGIVGWFSWVTLFFETTIATNHVIGGIIVLGAVIPIESRLEKVSATYDYDDRCGRQHCCKFFCLIKQNHVIILQPERQEE
jgi:hypothetical protein